MLPPLLLQLQRWLLQAATPLERRLRGLAHPTGRWGHPKAAVVKQSQ